MRVEDEFSKSYRMLGYIAVVLAILSILMNADWEAFAIYLEDALYIGVGVLLFLFFVYFGRRKNTTYVIQKKRWF